MISTESVLTYYIRGCTANEEVAVVEFNDWLSSIWDEAFERGMAKEGAGGGEIEPCPYL